MVGSQRCEGKTASARTRTNSVRTELSVKRIHHHDVVGLERRDEDLIEVGQKRVAVHRPIGQAGRGQA